MSREELYAAMQSIDNLRHADGEQHESDLEMLKPAPLKKPWIATRTRSQRITARQSLQLGDIAELAPAQLRLVAVLWLPVWW
jgi:hypothetical protein